ERSKGAAFNCSVTCAWSTWFTTLSNSLAIPSSPRKSWCNTSPSTVIWDWAILFNLLLVLYTNSTITRREMLREVSASTSAPVVNVNLALSHRLLGLTERQRALQLSRLLGEIVSEAEGAKVLLDNSESLFDVYLQKNPLCWLQELAGTPRSGRVG